MVRLILLLTLLIATVIAAPYLLDNEGYVMIAAGGYVIDATATAALLMVIGFYFVLLAIEAIVGKFSHGLGWFYRYHQRKAKQQTEQALLALASGDFKRAQTLTLKAVKKSALPALNYLAAAQSAQGLGDSKKRDEYLVLAHEHSTHDSLAITLTQAKLHIEQQEFEQALSILTNLHDKQPKHKVVLSLLKQVCLQRQEWGQLLTLIPQLQKQKLLTPTAADELRTQCHFNYLQEVATQQGSVGLMDTWSKLPKVLKHDGRYLAEVATLLMQRNDHESAYLLVMDALGNEFYPELVSLTPQLQRGDYHSLIERLKRLQQSRKGSGLLAVSIGQLLVKEARWEEAVSELTQGIKQVPSINAFAALAKAYEKLQRNEDANATYKQSLQFSLQVSA